MKEDPIESLQRFYDSLDSIPTPPLPVRHLSLKDVLRQLGLPLAAACVTYLFLIYCGSTPVRPDGAIPVSPTEKLALRELQSDSPISKLPDHLLFVFSWRRWI